MTETSPTKSKSAIVKSMFANMFQALIVTFSVGIIVATLYTAWTPPVLQLTNQNNILSSALNPETAIESEVLTPTPRPRPVIGIVVGHLGNDSGAVCPDQLGGFLEVDLNEAIADTVIANLKAENFDVDKLEEFDNRLEGYKALALVSIHADSCEYVNEQATGFKVAAAWGSMHPEKAARFTACLRNRYSTITELSLHSTSVTNDMTSYHAFQEVHEDTTAVIIETGFMNLDRAILSNQPDLIAEGITQGILCFIYNESVTP